MKRSNSVLLAALVGLGLSASTAEAAAVFPYFQTNLVSNLSTVGAEVVDPNLQNPWGVSESSSSPLWVSDQAAGVSTLYTIHGVTATQAPSPSAPLVVTIGGIGPTGQVNNSNTSSFIVSQTPTPAAAHFIFANLNGTISAWNGTGTTAFVETPSLPAGTSYTGLAINQAQTQLYAADNGRGTIDVFNSSFAPVTLPVTPTGPAFATPGSILAMGLVPFNVQDINGTVYVTYALPGHAAQTMAAGGEGAVALFTEGGSLLSSFTSPDLASPWGVALAPAGFGPFGGDLLVGNFAYGNLSAAGAEINAYNPTTDAFIATLDSNPAWQGLWALTFGNGGSGGDPNTLYFTTGLGAETNGLLAALSVVPEPSGLAILGTALALFAARRARSRRRA
jgi:uncharacterized protein (TIGR03118 family)